MSQSMPTARPFPSPNAPTNPNAPAGLDRPPMAGPESKQPNPQLGLQIHSDVEKLYQMALELKQQVEATDLNAVLSLAVVKKAQQIEKLAKRIKEEAKG
jgi:hypothetical protein